MITKCTFDNKSLRFVNEKQIKNDNNVFTIIVGKNGTGKSRLISAVANNFLDRKKTRSYSLAKELEFDNADSSFFEYTHLPEKIIAVSTSPFDRFPLIRFRKEPDNYSYLGIRDLITHNFGLSYLAKVIGSLIETIVREPAQLKRIISALSYLGYGDRIHIRLNPRISIKQLEELINSASHSDNFNDFTGKIRPQFPVNKRFFENEDGSISKTQITYLRKALERIKDSQELSKGYSVVEIDKNGISPQYSFSEYYQDLVFFMKSGIVRLRDIVLEKKNIGIPYSINNASSGEQSIIISILGIASQIKDYSIICIDEPEICLHPEWQERYIELLINTFSNYKGCHFIIATHSPQITSNAKSKNSFILSMESGVLIDANDVINESVDFQLANIFNSPGFKNEFLVRIALNTFTKVTKKKYFDKEDKKNFGILYSQEEFLNEGDPVIDLLKAIKDLHKMYA